MKDIANSPTTAANGTACNLPNGTMPSISPTAASMATDGRR